MDHSLPGTAAMTVLWIGLLVWLAILPLRQSAAQSAASAEVASHVSIWFVLFAAMAPRIYSFIPKLTKLTMDFGVDMPEITRATCYLADWLVEYFWLLLPVLVLALAVDGAVLFRLRNESKSRIAANCWSVLTRVFALALNGLSIAALWAPALKVGKWPQP
jgi:type II secretory pathway component PulF